MYLYGRNTVHLDKRVMMGEEIFVNLLNMKGVTTFFFHNAHKLSQ